MLWLRSPRACKSSTLSRTSHPWHPKTYRYAVPPMFTRAHHSLLYCAISLCHILLVIQYRAIAFVSYLFVTLTPHLPYKETLLPIPSIAAIKTAHGKMAALITSKEKDLILSIEVGANIYWASRWVPTYNVPSWWGPFGLNWFISCIIWYVWYS